jgi:bifunctional non-homologous end joining protein LigD
MLLLPASELPDDDAWLYEVKLDGYRAVAFKTGGQVQLRSRNDSDFTRRYAAVSAIPPHLRSKSLGVLKTTVARNTSFPVTISASC